MPLLSALVNNDGSIYAAGILPGDSFRVEKINFISNVENIFPINIDDNRYIVSKILIYDDVVFAILCGEAQDLVISIDVGGDGKIQEIHLPNANISSISDISIKNSTLYILSGDCLLSVFSA
jgi:hypothetical protein